MNGQFPMINDVEHLLIQLLMRGFFEEMSSQSLSLLPRYGPWLSAIES